MVFCCLELDLMKGNKLEQLLQVKVKEQGGSNTKELMKYFTAEQRKLQAVGCNLLVTATLLSAEGNQNRARMIEGMLQLWHQAGNKALRDVNRVKPWLLE